jgi:hypothetical protein
VNLLAAHGALFLAGEEGRFAAWAQSLRRCCRQAAADVEMQLPRKVVDQPSGCDVGSERVAPVRQEVVGIRQFQRSDTRMIAAAEGKSWAKSPACPALALGRQQALAGDHQHAGRKMQPGVEIDLEPGQYPFVASELRIQLGPPVGRQQKCRRSVRRRVANGGGGMSLRHDLTGLATRLQVYLPSPRHGGPCATASLRPQPVIQPQSGHA